MAALSWRTSASTLWTSATEEGAKSQCPTNFSNRSGTHSPEADNHSLTCRQPFHIEKEGGNIVWMMCVLLAFAHLQKRLANSDMHATCCTQRCRPHTPRPVLRALTTFTAISPAHTHLPPHLANYRAGTRRSTTTRSSTKSSWGTRTCTPQATLQSSATGTTRRAP